MELQGEAILCLLVDFRIQLAGWASSSSGLGGNHVLPAVARREKLMLFPSVSVPICHSVDRCTSN
jgi:hypothetical protein